MRATSETIAEIKNHITETLQLLRQLRDEIRVELHLAGMEAQERWKGLEPKLARAEKLGHDVTDATKLVLSDTLSELKAFKVTITASRQTGKKA